MSGASTGGFTDCLLQHGAGRVYAIDVGYGVLHWKLRQNARVVSMERTNARFVASLPEKIRLVTIDASFISLQIILPVVKTWLEEENGQVVALIKPQFQAGQVEAARGEGVIRDPLVHRRVLNEVLGICAKSRLWCERVDPVSAVRAEGEYRVSDPPGCQSTGPENGRSLDGAAF